MNTKQKQIFYHILDFSTDYKAAQQTQLFSRTIEQMKNPLMVFINKQKNKNENKIKTNFDIKNPRAQQIKAILKRDRTVLKT